MILLIDGYNLIKNALSVSTISDHDKSLFIKKLHYYAKKKGHKIILFFDGGGFGFPSAENVGLVRVIYSGYKQSADELIKSYILENKNQDLLLITSDREIRSFASQFRVQSLPALDFYFLLKNDQEAPAKAITAEKTKDTLYKTTSQDTPDLDTLMEEASRIMIRKTEDRGQEPKNKHQNSISRKDKKLVQKLKKL